MGMRRSTKWLNRWAIGLCAAITVTCGAPLLAFGQDASTAPSDSANSYQAVRGLEQEPSEGGAGPAVANALLFVPRKILDGLLYSMAYGSYVSTESGWPARVSELLTFYHERFGIHPIVSLSSGSQTEFGAELAYRVPTFGASISGRYGNDENWGTKVDVVSEFAAGSVPFKLSLSGFLNNRDDFEFFGFGPDPLDDPRSPFQPDAQSDHGVYAQRLPRVSMVLAARVRPRLQLSWTSFYQERRVSDPGGAEGEQLDETFDVSALPGADRKGRQVYSEGSLRFDTRESDRKITSGFRVDAYAGYSFGVEEDESRFRRLGIDVAPYIAILQDDRIIVPRVVLDTVDDLNEDFPISFADYPRQPTFRGAPRTRLLRTDEVSAVPSLEYRWPLSNVLNGNLFLDYLLVANSVSDLSFADAPYAWGAGFVIQGARSELGRFAISSGSEGLRFMIELGSGAYISDRTRWQ
jgi:hypothetical protein